MFFVIDENKNLIEGLDKEGVIALLEQAIEDGDLSHIEADSAFVSKLKSLVNGTTHHIEFVTQAQFNQLEHDDELVSNTYYFITDDDTAQDLENAVNNLLSRADDLENAVNNILDGTTTVPKAGNAEEVNNLEIIRDENGVLKIGDIVIPQKKVIWSGNEPFNNQGLVSLSIETQFKAGEKVEVVVADENGFESFFTAIIKGTTDPNVFGFVTAALTAKIAIPSLQVTFQNSALYGTYASNTLIIMGYGLVSYSVNKIYKIIE